MRITEPDFSRYPEEEREAHEDDAANREHQAVGNGIDRNLHTGP